MKTKTLAFVGPLPEPVTGISYANEAAMDYLSAKHKTLIFNTSDIEWDGDQLSMKRIFLIIKLSTLFLIKIFRINKIYISLGQTKFGFIKTSVFTLISYLFRKPVYAHVHGNRIKNTYISSGRFLKSYIKIILKIPKKFIFLSPSLYQNVKELIKREKVEIVPNFVRSEFIIKDITVKKLDKIRILFLSNLIKSKGIIELLEATRILQQKNLDFVVDIAGDLYDSEVKIELERSKKRLGNNFTYHGFLKGNQKRAILQNSNIFVLPTYYLNEAQPISILEAMGSGNVIVTTKNGGISDIIKEKNNGFFVKEKSPADLAKIIEKQWANQDLLKKIMRNNIDEVKRKYQLESFCQNVENVIFENG